MKKHFVFCHGFGFDKNFWSNLAPYFAKEKCTYLDLGYFGNKCEFNSEESKLQLVGIGHSLGLTKLLNLNKHFDYLIGLNSFTNFLGNDLTLRNKKAEELYMLKNSFIKYPLRTLKNFYQICGFPSFINHVQPEKINHVRMLTDLDSLFISIPAPKNTPILIIGSENDKIVPPILLHDNFINCSNVKLEITPSGKHALGFLEVEKIYKKIMSFIDNAAENKN